MNSETKENAERETDGAGGASAAHEARGAVATWERETEIRAAHLTTRARQKREVLNACRGALGCVPAYRWTGGERAMSGR